MAEAVLTKQVAILVGVPRRTLAHWVSLGLLNPEGARRGRRNPALWHAKDIREATVLAACRLAGYSLQKLRGAAEYLKSIGHNPFSTGDFVVVSTGDGEPGELIKICTDGEALALIRQPGQVIMALPIEGRDPEL